MTAASELPLPLTGALFWLRPYMLFFGDGDAGGQALEPFKGLRFSVAGTALDTLPDPVVGFGFRQPCGVLTPPRWLPTLTGLPWAGCIAGKPVDLVRCVTGLGCCRWTLGT